MRTITLELPDEVADAVERDPERARVELQRLVTDPSLAAFWEKLAEAAKETQDRNGVTDEERRQVLRELSGE